MSRSYKRTPWSGDHKGKNKKRVANSKVRGWLKQHPNEKLPFNHYKRITETWEICDYGWICPWKEYWEREVRYWKKYDESHGKPFPDKKAIYREWLKWYHNK